jgi:hypothetical protein
MLLPLTHSLSSFKIFALVLIALGALMLLAGCASPGVAIYQSTIAGRAAVQATSPLVATNPANTQIRQIGQDVSVAGATTHDALVAWNTARLSGDAITTAANTAEAALVTLESKLGNLAAAHAQSGQQRAAATAAKAKLQVGRIRAFVQANSEQYGSQKKIAPAAIAAILEIATTELPVLVNWINSALANNTVTDAQIQTELDGFAADLAGLDALLAPAPTN